MGGSLSPVSNISMRPGQRAVLRVIITNSLVSFTLYPSGEPIRAGSVAGTGVDLSTLRLLSSWDQGDSFTGTLLESIAYSGQLSVEDDASVIEYLGNKFNIYPVPSEELNRWDDTRVWDDTDIWND